MSNFLIKGNGVITYLTMDGTTAKSIPSYSSISEVHTVSRDGGSIVVWRRRSRINSFSSFEPGKTYIVYTSRNTSDFVLTTNGLSNDNPAGIPLISNRVSAIGRPFMFTWPSKWERPIAVSDYDSYIRVAFTPSTTGKMLRSYIPKSKGNGFVNFEGPGAGLSSKGYTVWAKQNFTIYNPDSAWPTATPFPTQHPPTPTPSTTPSSTPAPTAHPTSSPTPTPSNTPDPTPFPEYAYITLNVISRESKTAIVEYTTDWTNNNPSWTPISISPNQTSQKQLVVQYESNLKYLRVRVRNLSNGAGYYTLGFTSPYNADLLTTQSSDQIYLQYTYGSYQANVVIEGLVPTPMATPAPTPTPYPTSTPNPTNPPTNTPNPTNPPTGTPGPTNLPTRTPDPTPIPTRTPSPTPTKSPTPTPTITVGERATISFDVDSKNNQTAKVEYKFEGSVNTDWKTVNIIPNQKVTVSDSVVSSNYGLFNTALRVKVSNISQGGGYYTEGFVPGADSQTVLTSAVRDNLYVRKNLSYGLSQPNLSATLYINTPFFPYGGCITGNVYTLPVGQTRLYTDAELATKTPIGSVTFNSFNITARPWTEKLVPTIPSLLEWFQIEFRGWIKIPKSGLYTFDLLSDDGVRFYVNNNLIISNDSIHPPTSNQGNIQLDAGYYPFRLSYFQGPKYLIACYLKWRLPGTNTFTLVGENDFVCANRVPTPTPTPTKSPTPTPTKSPTPTPTIDSNRIITFAKEDVVDKNSFNFIVHSDRE